MFVYFLSEIDGTKDRKSVREAVRDVGSAVRHLTGLMCLTQHQRETNFINRSMSNYATQGGDKSSFC